MSRIFAFLLLAITLLGCRNKLTPSTDPQENRYYRLYKEIYDSWGKIPSDSIQKQLVDYLKEFPENADAQMLAGNLAYQIGDYQQAIGYYQKSISLNPDKVIFYSALGTAFNALNQTDSAEKYLIKAISLKDSSLYTFLNTSLVYLKKKDREKCFAYADSAYQRDKKSPVICSGLSFIYGQWKEPEKSKELFEEAVALGLKDTLAFNKVLMDSIKLEDYYRKNY